MLDHPLIEIVLGVDFFGHKDYLEDVCDTIVYTGPIDRYFQQYGYETLEYRSIIFTEERHFNHPGHILPSPVLNYPTMHEPDTIHNYTRAVEYKQYLHRHNNHSIVVKETSSSSGDPYYPVPTKRNQELYEKYQKLAKELEQQPRSAGNSTSMDKAKTIFVGRLANYKYFNMDQAIDNALNLFYQTYPTIQQGFMTKEFREYKQIVEQSMIDYDPSLYGGAFSSLECPKYASDFPMWTGEFGKELRVMVPWAYSSYLKCRRGQDSSALETSGVPGTKYLYFFNYKNHKVNPNSKRGDMYLPNDNPFGSKDVHMDTLPTTSAFWDNWSPPPIRQFFYQNGAFKNRLNDLLSNYSKKPTTLPGQDSFKMKPLVVILNKYSIEWNKGPVNYFSVETLEKMLDYLTPNYTVLYKRHTSYALMDHQGLDGQDLQDKEMIRDRYPNPNDVMLFEDFSEGMFDGSDYVEDTNLLLFAFMSMSEGFLTVQGGTAVTGSYFGKTNIILIKAGKELKYNDYNYFHEFSNAAVVPTNTDESFLNEMKQRF